MSTFESDVANLEKLDLRELRQRWKFYYRSVSPTSMSKELLIEAIAFKIQEAEFGGLNRRTLLKLSSFNPHPGIKNRKPFMKSVPAPKSGTKFLREWQGVVHEVLTLEDGQFAYAGNCYRSLTMIAQHITKTHQSGPRFFGLKNAGIKVDG